MARDIRAQGGRAPGFGHPVHRPLDPRAERILALSDQRGVSGPHVELARRFGHLTAAQAGWVAAESGVRTLVLTHFSQRYANPDRDLRQNTVATHARDRPVRMGIARDGSTSVEVLS